MELQTSQLTTFLDQIGNALTTGKQKAAQELNATILKTYWEIGKHIVECEQKEGEKAEVGTALYSALASELSHAFGKVFDGDNISAMRMLYFSFQMNGALSFKLTWSHYLEILKSNSSLEIGFYTLQAEMEGWSVEELKRQINNKLFERLSQSNDKLAVLQEASNGLMAKQTENSFQDKNVRAFMEI
ncbi:DUF1016 N-terminal domain-containing protein [Haliscomenobacter sp.]|uniref:DUF1016 N-terminal domain-containing protein n=1 Tax=Haliscomenobacter sp. TaxID=2717303 RepID=UPI003364B868